MTSVLRLERRDHVALLVIDRPERPNAIGSDTVAELHQHLDVIEADPELSENVITGQYRAVSAGADMSEPDTLQDGAE